MKKNSNEKHRSRRKLSLNRETLRKLQQVDLQRVNGCDRTLTDTTVVACTTGCF